MADEKPKHPGGRPSLYKPEYCEAIIKHMSQGFSAVSFAASIGVCRDTIYGWCEDHEEFSYAYKKAHVVCQAWWEQIGHRGMLNLPDKQGNTLPGFNPTMWIFNLKARFGWRDVHSMEISGRDGGPIEMAAGKLTDEQIEERCQKLLDKARDATE